MNATTRVASAAAEGEFASEHIILVAADRSSHYSVHSNMPVKVFHKLDIHCCSPSAPDPPLVLHISGHCTIFTTQTIGHSSALFSFMLDLFATIFLS